MNATLPSLPNELFSSLWRHRPQAPLTPPMSSSFHARRLPMTLPPIAHLDRQLPPLTPPQELARPSPHEHVREKPFQPPDAPHLVDWLDFTRTRSALFIAEKTCEMICYLWFASSRPAYPSPSSSPSFSAPPNSATSTLQLVASPTFVRFMKKLLETTQVSQSVIVLSLHYIYRLKERNRFTAGQPGSEFRIAVAALMMANKFLDDNTYTNKTWSEVSGIDLVEINKMEREFLVGVDFGLYVDKSTYESWLNLLKGLVLAKERDSRRWKSRTAVRAPRLPSSRSGEHSPRTHSRYSYSHTPHRARSTSPKRTARVPSYPYPTPAPPPLPMPTATPVTPRSGAKRSAEDAFSPTSAAFAHIPAKRPVSMSLQIPEPMIGPGSSSHSPLEGLQSFAKMSLAGSPSVATPPQRASWREEARRDAVPHTLVTAYAADEQRQASAPQNLYFYTLACSPMDDEDSRWRKTRLYYHKPPPPSTAYRAPQPSRPLNIQSAHASPHDTHRAPPPALPHFHDLVWSQPAARQVAYEEPPHPHYDDRMQCDAPRRQYDDPRQYAPAPASPVRAAPFANAGPPGVHFYPTPTQRTPPIYAPDWRRR